MSHAGLPADPHTALAALREQGAAGCDPARWRYLERLAQGLDRLPATAQPRLAAKLDSAITDYRQRFAQQQAAAQEALAQLPPAAEADRPALEQLFANAQFTALRRQLAAVAQSPQPSALAELTRLLGQTPPAAPGVRQPAPELKSLHYFRDTWSQLSVDRQLSQMLARTPDNAGPLNSHLLVLRSLTLMRDLAPAYLSSFLAYAEALLWLEQAGGLPATAAKSPSKSVNKTPKKNSDKADRPRKPAAKAGANTDPDAAAN